METGFYDFAVEENRAGATLANDATDMRAGKADGFTQKMRQQHSRLDFLFVSPAVDRDLDRLFHIGAKYRLGHRGSSESG
jgi:hypothetical protein